SSSWDTSSSSNATAPPGSWPRAISRTAITKLSTWSAISAAKSPKSSCGPSTTRSDIELPPSFKRPAKGHFVGIFEIAAHRQSAGESRHPQPHRLDQPGEIRRRRFAFEIRISREDELGDRSVSEPSQQLPHPEVVGPDS